MQYNKTTHRYVLERIDLGVYGNVPNMYGSDNKLDIELNKQSMRVYTWIYSNVPVYNKDYIEYVLAKHNESANFMLQLLLAQYEYDIASGGNEVGNQVGIDFNSGMSIDRQAIKRAMVSPIVESLFENGIQGFNFIYQGRYSVPLGQDRYTKYDY